MGLEPEEDSTAVWRHLPADTEREKPVIRMRMKRNVPDTQYSGIKECTWGFYNQHHLAMQRFPLPFKFFNTESYLGTNYGH